MSVAFAIAKLQSEATSGHPLVVLVHGKAKDLNRQADIQIFSEVRGRRFPLRGPVIRVGKDLGAALRYLRTAVVQVGFDAGSSKVQVVDVSSQLLPGPGEDIVGAGDKVL